MKWFLIAVAALHAVFTLCELFPWSCPVLLRIVSKKLPEVHKGKKWTELQQPLVATIVHNAGIYNAILAGGLFWAALAGDPARHVARVLLIGAAVAGIFGTATLKSPITAIQALVGIVGFVLL
jgi:uncharacterized membrane protein